MCCGAEGFNLDLGAKRATHLSATMLSRHRHCHKKRNLLSYLSDLPYVENAGNAPVLPVFNGTLLLS